MWWMIFFVILLLLSMTWQDFKYRAISIWLFLLVLGGLAYLKYSAEGMHRFFADLQMNLLFLVVQFLGLFGYFALKERRWVNLFKGYLGEGDLLFLILLASYFSFFNFLAFHILSLLLVLLFGLYFKKRNPKIPLAGGQALCLALLMSIDYFNQKLVLTEDYWLLSFFQSLK